MPPSLAEIKRRQGGLIGSLARSSRDVSIASGPRATTSHGRPNVPRPCFTTLASHHGSAPAARQPSPLRAALRRTPHGGASRRRERWCRRLQTRCRLARGPGTTVHARLGQAAVACIGWCSSILALGFRVCRAPPAYWPCAGPAPSWPSCLSGS